VKALSINGRAVLAEGEGRPTEAASGLDKWAGRKNVAVRASRAAIKELGEDAPVRWRLAVEHEVFARYHAIECHRYALESV
jgi:hypothetical protein